MAQVRRDDLHSGTTNVIMNALHAEDWMGIIELPIIAGNELSNLQQIQGGQQIGEETSAIHGSRIPRVPMAYQLANRRLTCAGCLRITFQSTCSTKRVRVRFLDRTIHHANDAVGSCCDRFIMRHHHDGQARIADQ